jgi:release factor glutamine methyltransferase
VSRGTGVRALLREAEGRLRDAGCETPIVDAEFLLAQVLGTTRSALRADLRRKVDLSELLRFRALVERREGREPLAYVLGEWGFRRLTLEIDPRVLVPRPETEAVVERCLALLGDREGPQVLDVGTGSGAIALAIADEHKDARVTGVDVSRDALDVARENAERNGLKIELAQADLFAALPEGPWDLVVSNPPYVRPDEIGAIDPEVREWEPRVALVAEGATEAIVEGARRVLRPDGALVLEVADGDSPRVAGLLRDLGYGGIRITPDLTGRDRVVEGTYP